MFLLGSSHEFYNELEIQSWVDLCLSKNYGKLGLISNDVEWKYLFRVVLRAIWNGRNRFVFVEEDISMDSTLYWIRNQGRQWQQVCVRRLIQLGAFDPLE